MLIDMRPYKKKAVIYKCKKFKNPFKDLIL